MKIYHRNEPCPDSDEILAYLNGRLNEANKARLEAHLRHCSFYTEAIVGLKQYPNLDVLPQRMASMADAMRKAGELLKRRRPVSFRRWLPLAATLVIGFGIALLTIDFPNDKLNERLFERYFELPLSPFSQNRNVIRRSQNALQEALLDYSQNNYEGALAGFQDVIKSEPPNGVVLFFSGVSCLALERPAPAVAYLHQALAITGLEYQDAVTWYLALAYLQGSELDSCRQVLRQVNVEGGFFTNKARDLLEHLGSGTD